MLHNFCFSFLPGITVVPIETEDNTYVNCFCLEGGGEQTRCIMGDVQMANGDTKTLLMMSMISTQRS